MDNIAGLIIAHHSSSKRLLNILIKNHYLDQIKERFDHYDLLDIEYKPFLRFHIADIFNQVFEGKIQQLFQETLKDRNQVLL